MYPCDISFINIFTQQQYINRLNNKYLRENTYLHCIEKLFSIQEKHLVEFCILFFAISRVMNILIE